MSNRGKATVHSHVKTILLDDGRQDAEVGYVFLVESLERTLGTAPKTRLSNSMNVDYMSLSFPDPRRRSKEDHRSTSKEYEFKALVDFHLDGAVRILYFILHHSVCCYT